MANAVQPAQQFTPDRAPYLCIPLRGKRGGTTLVTERHYAKIAGHRWVMSPNGYASSMQVGLLHRFILNAGPQNDVDHRNFNRLDNRDENILLCTRAENRMRNRRRGHSAWKYKGVRQITLTTWQARIRINYKEMYLGTFPTEEEAARAYDAAAERLFGQFAVLNLGGEKQ